MVEILNAHGTNAKGIVPSTKKKITMNAIEGKILQHTAYKGGGAATKWKTSKNGFLAIQCLIT